MTISKKFEEELSKVEVDRGIEPVKAARRVKPDEALRLIGGECILGGLPMLNVRTRSIEIEGVPIPSNDLSRLYMGLSTPTVIWSKELVVDAVTDVATRNSFDPVAVYLHNLNKANSLPDKDWFNLDQFLFNIDDPIARAFMPRYLVAAVKRAIEPACQNRQIPVIIGSQNIGKTELGRSLFGKYYGGGISGKFDIDDITKLERLWCCELAELDGITRKGQIEGFKTFISDCENFDRRKYGQGIVKIVRRNVFWGTSNTPPLNDSSGTTRFVCIPVPKKELPYKRVGDAFDQIWSRAYWEYRRGYQCFSTQEEMDLIEERNSDFEYVDSWFERIEEFVENTTLELIPTQAIHELLDLEPRHLGNPSYSTRIRKIMAKCGWKYDRLTIGGDQKRGYIKIDKKG